MTVDTLLDALALLSASGLGDRPVRLADGLLVTSAAYTRGPSDLALYLFANPIGVGDLVLYDHPSARRLVASSG